MTRLRQVLYINCGAYPLEIYREIMAEWLGFSAPMAMASEKTGARVMLLPVLQGGDEYSLNADLLQVWQKLQV
ncbi:MULTISPECIES: hypothetical protein [unclassified Phaeobacter]|uniref:hypothetical protein n=1 Tax=unclassified Phaeobacter TaxID=2621772 RepID=UPI003A83D1EB